MAYACKILADSISPYGHRLTTFEVTFPRIVLAEVNTHRMLSRSSASSRAIPVTKRIAQVIEDPFVPSEFGRNTKGMQHAETLAEEEHEKARLVWGNACKDAVVHASLLGEMGVHKQLANRLIEPFAWHTAVLTATDWSNFFALRVNPAAQGEFRTAAEMMLAAFDESRPRFIPNDGWHLPYVSDGEELYLRTEGIDPVKISIARCARVSYLTQDGVRDPKKDLELYDRLVAPGHMAPLEHAARPMDAMELGLFLRWEVTLENERTLVISVPPEEAIRRFRLKVVASREVFYCGNFNGWVQRRKEIPCEADFSLRPKDDAS